MAAVVVWEWQNEYGSWRPYSPQISAYLESNKLSTTPLPLGSIDPILYLYHVDVQNLYQSRQGTGDILIFVAQFLFSQDKEYQSPYYVI